MIIGNLKQKILAVFAVAIIAILVLIFQRGLFSNTAPDTKRPANSESAKQEISQDAEPQIVSTKPDPLEDATVQPAEVVEITFNRPLENVGEFKSRIDPKIDYKVELSSDRKTAKIVPVKPYQLGITYTLFIGPDSKFDGVGAWGKEKIIHFRTIQYRGV